MNRTDRNAQQGQEATRIRATGPKQVRQGVRGSYRASGLLGPLALALTALALVVPFGYVGGQRAAILLISIAHLVVGFSVFVIHGGRRITATALYFLAVAVLVGGAGTFLATIEGMSSLELLDVSLGIMVSNVILLLLVRNEDSADLEISSISPHLASSAARYGALMLASSLVANAVPIEALDSLTVSAAFSGVVLLFAAFALCLHPDSRCRPSRYALIAATGFLVHYIFFFAGFGRLNIVVLLVCAAVLVNSTTPRSWHKGAIVAAVVPALVVGGLIGLARRPAPSDLGVGDVLRTGAGLGSVTGPLSTFAELVELDRQNSPRAYPRQYGQTFVEAMAAPIPAGLWPGKPPGFGFKLTLRLLPQYAPAGHSMAALAFGEWYVNYSWLGLVLVPLVVGAALRSLDRAQRRRSLRGIRSRGHILHFAALATLAAGLADFVWAGLFTYVARAGIRVLVILAVWALVAMTESSPSNRYWRSSPR